MGRATVAGTPRRPPSARADEASIGGRPTDVPRKPSGDRSVEQAMADPTRAHVWSNTDSYEAFMGRWSRPVAEAALAWLGHSPELAWLDVGCGTGALTRAILDEANPRAILGVDPSA